MNKRFTFLTGAENQVIIDGLNSTNVSHGTEQGMRLNFDFVEEVEVITGGCPPSTAA